MSRILDLVKQRKVNYDQVIGSCWMNVDYFKEQMDTNEEIRVIIPVRGRDSFLPILLESFDQTKNTNYRICVVEHSDKKVHAETCSDFGVSYIHIPANGGIFNKCLCHNIAAFTTLRSDYLLFHDLDCLVQEDFFYNINACIDINQAEALQSFKGKRVLFCDAVLTARLLQRDVNVNELSIKSGGVIASAVGAPGGSILCSYDLFFKVGGFDPELFWSYSPEDQFFLHKLQMFTTVYSCDGNEVFHLNHPPSVNLNPDLNNLIGVMREFRTMSVEEQREVVEYKANLIKQYR
jgi:predicted glycosyltransferase involved in capsule biosynthesis